MNINPLKPLLDSFDALINERGSSAILRERLAFAFDQYAALEQQLAACQKKKDAFKITNQNLNNENECLKADNEKLKQKIRDSDKDKGDFSSGVIIS